MILSFPQKDLSFTLDNFVHQFCFFLSDFVNVDLKFDCFAFHFLEFLNEFRLKVDIFIFKFGLLVAVDSNIVVELVHFLLKTFEIDFDFFNFSLKSSIIVIEPGLFLLHDGLFVFEVLNSVLKLLEFVVLVHQDSLLLDPLSIKLITVLLQFLSLSHQVDQLIL